MAPAEADKSAAPRQEINRVCMYAFQAPPGMRTTTHTHDDDENNDGDQLHVQISVSVGAVPMNNPVNRVTSPMILWNRKKTFHLPTYAFLSGYGDDMIANMIESLSIAFPLQNIHWGLTYPRDDDNKDDKKTNNNNTSFRNLDEIVADGRLLHIARNCYRGVGYMDIRIMNLIKFPPEHYQELRESFTKVKSARDRGPLDDWILENQNDVNLRRENCLEVIYKLAMKSPADNRYFGLKSVKIKEDHQYGEGSREGLMMNSSSNSSSSNASNKWCSICMKGLKTGSQAIRMPCSHIFHGFCIFPRIAKNPTCPVCCFELCSNPVL